MRSAGVQVIKKQSLKKQQRKTSIKVRSALFTRLYAAPSMAQSPGLRECCS